MRIYRIAFWFLIGSLNFLLSSCLVLGGFNGAAFQAVTPGSSPSVPQVQWLAVDASQLSANVSFSNLGNAANYQIQVTANGAVVPGLSSVPLSSNNISIPITGLDSGTNYAMQVQVWPVGGTAPVAQVSGNIATPHAWMTAIEKTPNTYSYFGSLGIPSTNNRATIAWMPNLVAGNGDHKYLFGGVIYDENGNLGNSNVLWRLDTLLQWTSLTGYFGLISDGNEGEFVHGALGQASFSYSPPALTENYQETNNAACVDANGNYWIYGGYSWGWSDNHALMRYNPSSGWALMWGLYL